MWLSVSKGRQTWILYKTSQWTSSFTHSTSGARTRSLTPFSRQHFTSSPLPSLSQLDSVPTAHLPHAQYDHSFTPDMVASAYDGIPIDGGYTAEYEHEVKLRLGRDDGPIVMEIEALRQAEALEVFSHRSVHHPSVQPLDQPLSPMPPTPSLLLSPYLPSSSFSPSPPPLPSLPPLSPRHESPIPLLPPLSPYHGSPLPLLTPLSPYVYQEAQRRSPSLSPYAYQQLQELLRAHRRSPSPQLLQPPSPYHPSLPPLSPTPPPLSPLPRTLFPELSHSPLLEHPVPGLSHHTDPPQQLPQSTTSLGKRRASNLSNLNSDDGDYQGTTAGPCAKRCRLETSTSSSPADSTHDMLELLRASEERQRMFCDEILKVMQQGVAAYIDANERFLVGLTAMLD